MIEVIGEELLPIAIVAVADFVGSCVEVAVIVA